MTWNELTNLGW